MTTTTDTTRYPENPGNPVNKAWEQEPDFLEWRDAATGLRCRIERYHEQGYLCGYVAMPRDHRLLRTSIRAARKRNQAKGNLILERVENTFISVHGGLTFFAFRPKRGPCNIDGAKTPFYDWTVTWAGFDCGHYSDYKPRLDADKRFLPADFLTYRTWEWVKAETEALARHVHATRR
jgi:hypothetical protein